MAESPSQSPPGSRIRIFPSYVDITEQALDGARVRVSVQLHLPDCQRASNCQPAGIRQPGTVAEGLLSTSDGGAL